MNTKQLRAIAAALAPIITQVAENSASKMAETIEARIADQWAGQLESNDKIKSTETLANDLAGAIAEIRQRLTEINSEITAAAEFDPEQVAAEIESKIFTALADVPAPKDGRDGAPGRDGVAIDILPAIDPEKSYPRGTYATHRGGIYNAHHTTRGWSGWQCIVNGLDFIKADQVSAREFVLMCSDSLGVITEKTFTLPAMIYRGVWSEQKYTAGDVVTWAGSLWHCDVDSEEKPGSGGGWTLCVKKGRDGKQ